MCKNCFNCKNLDLNNPFFVKCDAVDDDIFENNINNTIDNEEVNIDCVEWKSNEKILSEIRG